MEYLAILKYAYHIQVIFIIEVDFYGLACLSLNANKFLQGPRNSSKVIRFGSFSAGLFLGFAWKWNFHRWAKLMNFNKGFCPSVGRPFSPVHYIVFAPLSSDKLNALTLPKKTSILLDLLLASPFRLTSSRFSVFYLPFPLPLSPFPSFQLPTWLRFIKLHNEMKCQQLYKRTIDLPLKHARKWK